jgi:hypothetical protein
MTRFLRRLVTATAVASIAMATVAVGTSTASPYKCDQRDYRQCVPTSDKPKCDLNWARNVFTGECHPQPAVPDWYQVRPPYAPPYAPVDVPPPPPPPPWAGQMQPRWDEGGQHWIWAGI